MAVNLPHGFHRVSGHGHKCPTLLVIEHIKLVYNFVTGKAYSSKCYMLTVTTFLN